MEEIPAEEDPFEASPASEPLSDSELASLKMAIDGALNGVSGATHSALIVGLDSGQTVYERTPDTARTPASNTKLFTTAAALAHLGEEHRSLVRVFGSAPAGGTVASDVVIVGEHDSGNSSWFAEDATRALAAAARAMKSSGINAISGDVVAKGEFVYEGNSVGSIDYSGERSEVAAALRTALINSGISVSGTATTAVGFDPPNGASVLATLPSASLDVVSHAINVPSHNEFADLLMHHLGFQASGESTYAAGVTDVKSLLDELSIDKTGFTLDDGSGLSHGNRVTPRQIVELLRGMLDRPESAAFLDSFAISGVRGTIAGRMTEPDVIERFWGKTGTLTGVIALSGVLFHRYDGQRYLASFLSNNVADATNGRAGLDAAVRALAKNLKGKEGLPTVPNFVRLTDDANKATAFAEWDDVPGAIGYLVWRSRDGRTWDRSEARYVKQLSHRMKAFDDSDTLFVRLTAWNDVGESAPSSIFACSISDEGGTVLLVDANDRYRLGPVPENPLSFGGDALLYHAMAIPSARFDSASNEAAFGEPVRIEKYEKVMVALGRESSIHETFTTLEQESVRDYITAGGSLFVSGAEIGFDLIGDGSPEDAAFARDVLGIDYVDDDARTTLVMPSAATPIDTSFARFSKLGRHEATFPDVLSPSGAGQVCLTYVGGLEGAACVFSVAATGGKIVVLGIPLEALDDPALRRGLVTLVD
jgi:serine-type D-Ala-D-Ala carboxypeptidase/endopeptidase (penicillin-binding protein 4)